MQLSANLSEPMTLADALAWRERENERLKRELLEAVAAWIDRQFIDGEELH